MAETSSEALCKYAIPGRWSYLLANMKASLHLGVLTFLKKKREVFNKSWRPSTVVWQCYELANASQMENECSANSASPWWMHKSSNWIRCTRIISICPHVHTATLARAERVDWTSVDCVLCPSHSSFVPGYRTQCEWLVRFQSCMRVYQIDNNNVRMSERQQQRMEKDTNWSNSIIRADTASERETVEKC